MTAWLLLRKTVRDAEKTRKSLHLFAFWVHKEATIGMHGQGQPAASDSRAGPARLRKRWEALSSLYVIVRLTNAANGSGRIAGELPPGKTDWNSMIKYKNLKKDSEPRQ